MSRDARLSDRIKQLSFDPSTGAFSLDSIATGFSPFSDFYEVGDVVFYAATDGTRYEVGSGEYTGSTVTRYPFRSNQISSGPYYIDAPSARESDAGVTGVWHPLYLTKSAASGIRGFDVAGGKVSPASGVHEHTFSGYPGVTFYMPNMEVAGHAQDSSVTKSGENYATSGAAVSFQGVTEVFVSYPGKYSVFSAGGISGYNEPKSKGIAFWGNEQILDYDANIVWDTGVDGLGVNQPSPVHSIDVGGLTSYSQVRASGFIGGGSGVQFSGGQALPQSSLKTASGGRQLEPFFRNELDTQTKSDQVFSLSGLVDERLLLQMQEKGMVFAGPPSGCTSTCSPNHPTFRFLEVEDIPSLSDLYIVQQNYVPYDTDVPAGSVAFTTASGKVEYSAGNLVFLKASNKLGINTPNPDETLSVNGNIKASGDVGVSGSVDIFRDLSVSGQINFENGPLISGGYHAGSGLEVHNNVAFNIGNMFQVSGNATATSGANILGWIHQGDTLQVSGISGVHASFIKIPSSGEGGGGSGVVTIDPTFMYNTISGAIVHTMENAGGTASGNNALHLASGIAMEASGALKVRMDGLAGGYVKWILATSGVAGADNGNTPIEDEITAGQYLAISGVSGISVDYGSNSLGGFLALSAASLSGYLDYAIGSGVNISGNSILGFASGIAMQASGALTSRLDTLAGGYVKWIIASSGAAGADNGNTPIEDDITAGQYLCISGVSGISVDYGSNSLGGFLAVSAASLSGWAKDYTDSLAGGVGSSGLTNQNGILDFRYDGSGSLNSLEFHNTQGYNTAIRLGEATPTIFEGVAAANSGDHVTSGVLIGYKAGHSMAYDMNSVGNSGAHPGVMVGDYAGAHASGENFAINIGHAAGYGKNTGPANGSDSTLYWSGPDYYNTLIGYWCGYFMTSGNMNNIMGKEAAMWGSGMYSDVIIGTRAAKDAPKIEHSIFIGTDAGNGSSGIINCNFIGKNTGSGLRNMSDSTLIGRNAGLYATPDDDSSSVNLWIGSGPGQYSWHSNGSAFIGQNVGKTASGVVSTYAIGKNTAFESTSIGTGILLGQNSAHSSSGLDHSIFIGTNSALRASGLEYNNFIGYGAGTEAGPDPSGFEGAAHEIAHGVRSSTVNAIGRLAFSYASGADYSEFQGYRAGAGSSGITHSVSMGYTSTLLAQEMSNTVAIGPYSAAKSYDVEKSVILGYEAGYFSGSETDSETPVMNVKNTVLIGNAAGVNASGLQNVIGIGTNALNFARAAQGGTSQLIEHGIFIGRGAGRHRTDSSNQKVPGDYNLIIEPYAAQTKRASWVTTDYQDYVVSIGYLMHGYSDPITPARYLQIGAEPASIAALQEAALTVKPDSASVHALMLRKQGAQSAGLLEVESAWNNQIIVNKQGVLQVPVATGTGAAGYSSMMLEGSTTTVTAEDGAIVLLKDGSTRSLMVAEGNNWYKLDLSAT